MAEVKKYIPKRRTDPAKNEEDRKGDYVVFRVTKRDKKKLDGRARKVNNKLSEYCRDIVLGHEPKDKTEEEKAYRRTVVGVASNLNQVTKYLNTYGLYPKLVEQIQAIVHSLAQSVL